MPVLAFQSRYRPRNAPFDSGVMSPFEDEVQPAFNPRLMDTPPPQAISDTRIDPPPANAPEAMPPITGSGPRKPFLMPPPGAQPKIEAEPPPVPEIQVPQTPPLARGAMPPPPLTAELPPLEVKQPVVVTAPTGADAREALGARPPSQADLVLKDKEKALADKLAARPAAPKENWGTRLATAILAMTKFAPVTDLIVHPKWSSQERQYGRDLEVAGQQFKVAQEALNAETLAEQREANSAMKNAQAAQAGVADATRRELNDPHRGMQEIDGGYVQQEMPWLKPDAEGKFWVDKTIANTLAKPEGAAPKPMIVPAGSTVVDENGRVLYSAPVVEKPERVPTSVVEWEAILNDPKETPERKAQAKAVLDAELARVKAGRPTPATGGSADDPKLIAQAIVDGNQPPNLQGLYRMGAPVRAELARQGYDLATAQRDWTAIGRHLGTLNGQQQERLRQAVTFTHDSLDLIDDLYSKWLKVGPASGFKVLNRAALQAAKQFPGETGSIAANLEAQINDLTSELGTVYKGGNASTDESLRLAAENLKADWNEKTFKAAIEQIRKNLKIRSNSIMNSQPVGVSPNSPYLPPMGGEITFAPTPQAETPPVSALKEGQDTLFANGQIWTLRGGKPTQVGGK